MTLWTKSDSQAIAAFAQDCILKRTARGVSATGKRFKPLADGSPSTLRDTGQLLDSLRATGTRTEATVSAGVEYARYVDQERPFLALTDAEVREQDTLFEQLLEENEERALNWKQGGRRR